MEFRTEYSGISFLKNYHKCISNTLDSSVIMVCGHSAREGTVEEPPIRGGGEGRAQD